MQSVALIDYGSGNLRSAEKALQRAAAASGRAAPRSPPPMIPTSSPAPT